MKCTVTVILWIKLTAEAENFTRARCIDNDASTVSQLTFFQNHGVWWTTGGS